MDDAAKRRLVAEVDRAAAASNASAGTASAGTASAGTASAGPAPVDTAPTSGIPSGYTIDYKKVIDACAANNVIIEINANPLRLDLDWRWHQAALTVEGNRESWGLMHRLGMTRRDELAYVDPRFGPDLNPTIVFRIDAAEWPAAREAALASRPAAAQ